MTARVRVIVKGCVFLTSRVCWKGKAGDRILAKLSGVPTSDKQKGVGGCNLRARLSLEKQTISPLSSPPGCC